MLETDDIVFYQELISQNGDVLFLVSVWIPC